MEIFASMKEFAAFVFLILLVVIGWNQPYKAHFTSVAGKPSPADSPSAAFTSSARSAPAPTPSRDSSWMWEKTSMDAPHAPINDDKGGGKRGR